MGMCVACRAMYERLDKEHEALKKLHVSLVKEHQDLKERCSSLEAQNNKLMDVIKWHSAHGPVPHHHDD